MAEARTDVTVIGAGITGLCAARALAHRGRDVVVLEQAEVGHRGGGSHGSCRIFRLGYETPEYVTLALRARRLWAELEADCGERLLHPAPQLTFGPQMPQVMAAMREAGAAFELLSAQATAGRFPDVSVAGPALYEPDSAVIAADRALAALAGQVIVRQAVRVTGLTDDGTAVRITTSRGDILARRAIVCAGPWSAELLATAGITIPGSATLEQVAYLSARAGDRLPILVNYGGEFGYGLPVPGSDRYKIGIHHGGPAVRPDRQDHAADPELGARIEQMARALLPGLDPVPVAVERCVYDNSPDTDFVVDRTGNVVIGSGTSGHGFKFGPLLGEWLASLATDDHAASPPPARFALGRF
jgi:sarcosine oxidase